jgi:hypothetical protein
MAAKEEQQNAKATAAARFFYKYANHLVSAGGSRIRHGKACTLEWPKIIPTPTELPPDIKEAQGKRCNVCKMIH